MDKVSHEEALEAIETIKKYCENGKRCKTCILFINKKNDFCGRNFLEIPCYWDTEMRD